MILPSEREAVEHESPAVLTLSPSSVIIVQKLDDLPGDDEDEREVEAHDLQPGKIYYDEDDGPLRDVSADTDFTLDHIILGCSDVDFACEQFTAMTGVKPASTINSFFVLAIEQKRPYIIF